MPKYELKSTPSNNSLKESTTMKSNPDYARQILVADFLQEAGWRHVKAQEYPEDPRNAQAASTLEAIAEYVKGLAAEDPRLLAVADATTDWAVEFGFLPNTVNQIGFHGTPPTDLGRELDFAIAEGLRELEPDEDLPDEDPSDDPTHDGAPMP